MRKLSPILLLMTLLGCDVFPGIQAVINGKHSYHNEAGLTASATLYRSGNFGILKFYTPQGTEINLDSLRIGSSCNKDRMKTYFISHIDKERSRRKLIMNRDSVEIGFQFAPTLSLSCMDTVRFIIFPNRSFLYRGVALLTDTLSIKAKSEQLHSSISQ